MPGASLPAVPGRAGQGSSCGGCSRGGGGNTGTARVRVRLEVELAPAAVGDVRVQLGRGEVGVPEHLLDAAQVGAALRAGGSRTSGGGGAGGRARLEAGLRGELRRMRKAPARVSGPPWALRKSSGRWPAVEVGPAAREVAAQRLDRLPADRDDPLLVPLADAADDAGVEVDAALSRPTASLTRSPAPYRSSTRARSRRSRGPVPFAASTSRSASPGESVRGRRRVAARKVQLGGRVVGSLAEQDEVAEERTYCGRAARHGRGREPLRAEIGEVALELLGRDRVRRAPEPVRERAQVAAVRLDGARRAPGGEEGEEAFDLRIGVHRPVFSFGGDSLPPVACRVAEERPAQRRLRDRLRLRRPARFRHGDGTDTSSARR